MKRVVNGKELRDKMDEAISMLCDTVKTTLGPKGSNVIIDHSSFSPFITNDGVTIAENIESDDGVINTILELAKEASVKTNEVVGDGTTTTLVLLQSIYNNGLKLIDEGINPILIKRELENILDEIVRKIKNVSRKPNKKELRNLAMVSANDKEIGSKISEVYSKIKEKSAIFIKEGNNTETKINYLNGYIINTILASEYFLKDLKEIFCEDAYILLMDNYLDNLNDISKVINEVILKNKNLIILAKDYDDLLVNEMVSLNLDNKNNIILLKNPEYGLKQRSILKDIEIITNAKIIEKLDNVDLGYMGIIKNIKIGINETIFSFEASSNVNKRIKEIEDAKIYTEDDIDLDFINRRLAMFNNGMAEILVGDRTTTARREKKMRYDDALCAISSAKDGILPGSGVIFLKISHKLNNENYGEKILKEALKAPFEQIMYNAGINYNEIAEEIEKQNYEVIYNLNNLKYENILETEIIDPTRVVINSLTSAVSIASMLLTTTSIVINEYKNNLNKINDYNEL